MVVVDAALDSGVELDTFWNRFVEGGMRLATVGQEDEFVCIKVLCDLLDGRDRVRSADSLFGIQRVKNLV